MDTYLSTHVNPRSCFVATQIVRNQLIDNSFYLQHVIKGTPLETVKWANIFLKPLFATTAISIQGVHETLEGFWQ